METSFINEILLTTSGWVRPYLTEIGFAMIATLLIIYGNNLTEILKKQIGGLQFFVRLTAFILFCAFGFALIANYLTPMLIELLASSGMWLGVVTLAVFYFIGILAQRKGII